MELANVNSVNPRLIVINETNTILNLKFYYTAIKESPIEIKNLKPNLRSIKNIPVLRLNGKVKLMMICNDDIDCVYDKLSANNDIITITLKNEDDFIIHETSVTSPKAKAVQLGSIIGKFYNIVIGILIALSAIAYIIQKLSK